MRVPLVEDSQATAHNLEGRDRITGDVHYLVGMLVAAHLDRAAPGWKKTVFTRPGAPDRRSTCRREVRRHDTLR